MLSEMLFSNALMGNSGGGGGGGGSALFVVGMNGDGILDKTYKEIVSAANNQIVMLVIYEKEGDDEYWEIRYLQAYNHYFEDDNTTYNVAFFNQDGTSYYSANAEDAYPKVTFSL